MTTKHHAGPVVWVIDSDARAYDMLTELSREDSAQELTVFSNFELMLAALGSGLGAPDALILDERHLDAFIGVRQTGTANGPLANAPFIVVSALADIETMERCFAVGAVDYLCKPLVAAEVIVKLRRHLARRKPSPVSIVLNQQYTSAMIDGVDVALTPREFQIMDLLHNSPERSMARQDLHGRVWQGVKVCNKVLDVHVSKLRKKLLAHGLQINFVKPNLYRLEAERRIMESELPAIVVTQELRRAVL